MKFLRSAVTCLSLASALTLPAVLRAADAAPEAHAGHAHHDSTPLGDQMDEIGGSMKKLRGTIADPAKYPEALALIAKIKAGVGEAKKLDPAMTADKPEAERPAFRAAYQKKMDELLAGLGDLEKALAAGDAAAVKAKFDALKELQKAGHKEFKKPDEKH